MPPTRSALAALDILEENSKEVYLDITAHLIRFATNIINFPNNYTYRRLPLENPIIAEKFFVAVGAMECLFEMGFQEAEDCLVLPSSTNIDALRKICEEIEARRDSILKGAKPGSVAIVSGTNPTPAVATAPNPAQLPSTSTQEPKMEGEPPMPHAASQGKFLANIEYTSVHVARDANDHILQLAKKYIPMEELEIAAQERMREIQRIIKKEQAENSSEKSQEPCMQELLVMQLQSWFKEKFFVWVNDPACQFCGGKTKFTKNIAEASTRVEVYRCTVCLSETPFKRYNDPEKLLETRQGRCGEWGKCFSVLCRAMGWETRYVLDSTDHVWTEIFFPSQNRWVHCDPCEEALDTPLMYELGWKKKLSYIFAFSEDDVQDVTWRYTTNFKEVLQRRTRCSETQLVETIIKIRSQRQQHLSDVRKAYLCRRILFELVDFLKEPKSGDEFHGRQSGSLAWRLSRGETSLSVLSEPYCWKPTLAEIEAREMRIQYHPEYDHYSRGPSRKEKLLKGWQNGAKYVENIFRKTEKDWNMVYLSRVEGASKGVIIWAVDLEGTNMVVDTVQLYCSTNVFHTGKVIVSLRGDHKSLQLDPGQQVAATENMRESGVLELSVELLDGDGETAWQHAQLFRTEIGNPKVTLDIHIKLKPASKQTRKV